MLPTLIQLCLDLVVAGVVLYIVYIVVGMIPMLAPFKQIVMAIVALIAVLVVWSLVGPLVADGLGGGRVGRLR